MRRRCGKRRSVLSTPAGHWPPPSSPRLSPMLSMSDRAAAYAASSWGQRFPGSIPHVGREQGRDVLYAIWIIGNDYRNPTKYYGAYPKGYLDRLMALFPDATDGEDILHAFSGALPVGNYLRCDSM